MGQVSAGSPFPIGCSYRNGHANFSISVERGVRCELLIFEKDATVPYICVTMSELEVGDLRCLEVEMENPETKEYIYLIEEKAVVDPYTRELSPSGRCCVVSEEYDWEDVKRPELAACNIIAYELHVKGFTAHPSSGVLNKGLFLGVVEKIDYLKDLGINQLQFLPIYEFEDQVQNRKNYWGYGNGLFFLPKQAYGKTDAVRELKDMVKALHQNGMEVIFDMPFTTDVSQTHMLDALRYWAMEYQVDGFLLNPDVVDWKMVISDPILSHLKLLKRQNHFQNVMRAYAKSDSGMVSEAISCIKTLSEQQYNYITSHDGFTLYDLVSYNEKHNTDNGECGHDGIDYNVSWNCGVEGETEDQEILHLRECQKRNLLYLLLLSGGTPCLLAGDEFGNSQNGNNNAYCQDNEISWLNWEDYNSNQEMYLFVRDLISLRMSCEAFHPNRKLDGNTKDSMGIPEISYHGEEAWEVNLSEENRSFSIFYHLKDVVDEFMLVMYNMDWEEHFMALPDLPFEKMWTELADTKKGILKESKKICEERLTRIGPRSIKVFVGK